MKRTSILLVACLSAALLAACGGSKSLPASPLSGGAASLVAADPQLRTAARDDGVAPSDVIARFHFTGSPQSYTVPSGVHALRIVVYGARGSAYYLGAPGARTYATINVDPGEKLGMFVGGAGSDGDCDIHEHCAGGKGGYNGGGDGGSVHHACIFLRCAISWGYGGGGASDVRRGGVDGTLDQRVIVAGGGGGQNGVAGFRKSHWPAGDGGNLTGQHGDSEYDGEGGGQGGTQTHGGAGGKIGDNSGQPGVKGVGGSGQDSRDVRLENPGGGGGGGWFGGGGGTGNNPDSNHDKGIEGSGGGGSSYAEPGACRVDFQRNPFPNRDDVHNGFIDILRDPECVPH